MRCYVILTDETGQYDTAVAKALDRAAAEGAKAILYDITAPGSAFTDPRPNKWAGEGEREMYEHPLEPVALEHLGRHELALQVQRARERGVDAFGWLPDRPGGDAIAAYAAREQADLVLAPADYEDKELAESAGVTVERV